MKNIFENVYFGKQYKTRDGRKAIYWCNTHPNDVSCPNPIDMIVDGPFVGKIHTYGLDGKHFTPFNPNLDIVSEWQEEIDEEELDKLATEYVKNIYQDDYCDFLEQEGEAFKAGYKAKEKNI